MARSHCDHCAMFAALHPTHGYHCRVYPERWRRGDPIGQSILAPAPTPAPAPAPAPPPAVVAPAPAVKKEEEEEEEKKNEDDKVVIKKEEDA
ncbi:hypothetical protein FKW77_002214 [Venturia effusa]|uniref:Uncharacterized protein n=1 Tax=Venturia effusa TaxID=50376 RepID=A0A517LMB5_9PEZI|nr:hypothetical protein FKW77_002214 [Venturia effusa]